jgi:PEP-CTERM motif
MRNVFSIFAAAFIATTGAAHSATISIGTALNGGLITLQAFGTAPGPVSWAGSVGGYGINVVDGVDLTAASLNSNAQDGTSAGTHDTLDIYVSVSGVTQFSGVIQSLSGLTVNLLTPGWTVVESTYEDNSDAVFGTANLLATHSFSTGPDVHTQLASVLVTTPFSVTEVYQISANGHPGSANDTIDLSAVVPEPSTWGLMGCGFAGLSLIGLIRRRKGLRCAL